MGVSRIARTTDISFLRQRRREHRDEICSGALATGCARLMCTILSTLCWWWWCTHVAAAVALRCNIAVVDIDARLCCSFFFLRDRYTATSHW